MGDLNTLRSQINSWTLDQDNKTFMKLDQMSTNIFTKFGAVSSDIRSVQHQANSIHAQINQVFNKFLTLSDSRFTEHRMAPPSEPAQKAPPPTNKDDTLTTQQKFTKALGIALQTLDLQQIPQDDDIFDDRDDKSISVFSAATSSGTVSKSVKLPAMYGTPQFNSNKFIGLFDSLDEPPEPIRQSAQPNQPMNQQSQINTQSQLNPQLQQSTLQQSSFQQQQPQQQNNFLSVPQQQPDNNRYSVRSQISYVDADNNQFITRTNSQLGNSMMDQFQFENPQQKQEFLSAFAPPYQQQQQQPGYPQPPLQTASQTQRPTVVDAPPPQQYIQPPSQQFMQPPPQFQQPPPQQFQQPPPQYQQPPPAQPQTLQDQLNLLMQQKREQQIQSQQQIPQQQQISQQQQVTQQQDRFSFQQTQQQQAPPIQPQQPQKVFQPPSVIGAPTYAQNKDKRTILFEDDDDDENDNSLFKSTSNNKNKFNTLLTDGVAIQQQKESIKPVTVVVDEEDDQFNRVAPAKPAQINKLFDETEEEGKMKTNADKIAAMYASQQQKQQQQSKPAPPPSKPTRNVFEDSDEEKKQKPIFTQQQSKPIEQPKPVEPPKMVNLTVEEDAPVRPSIQQLQNKLNLNMFMKPPGEQITMKDIKKNERENESEFIEQQADRPVIQKKKARARQALDFDDDEDNKKPKKPTFTIKEKTSQEQKAEAVIDRQSYRESIKLNKQSDFEVPITIEVKTEKKDIQITAQLPSFTKKQDPLSKPSDPLGRSQDPLSKPSDPLGRSQDPLSKKNVGKEFEEKGLPNFFNDPLGGGAKKPNQPVQIGNLPGLGGKQTQQQPSIQVSITPSIQKPQRKNMFSDEEDDQTPQIGKPVQRVEPPQPVVQQQQFSQPLATNKPTIKKNMFDDDSEEDFKPISKPQPPQVQQQIVKPVVEAQKKPEPPKPTATQQRNQRMQRAALFDDSD